MVELGFSNNDLDEKFHNMIELAMEEPCIQKMIDNRGTPSLKLAFQFYILWTCSHADEMVQRKVLDDNEWAGWLQWMRNCFRKASIKETWKQVEQDRWFNPAFQNFIYTDMVGAKLRALSKIIIKSDQLSNICAFLLRWPLISSKTASWFALTAVSWWSSSSSFEVKLCYYYHMAAMMQASMETTGLYLLCRHLPIILNPKSESNLI